MQKTSPIFNKVILVGILSVITPIFAYAEAGKSITSGDIIFAIFVLVSIAVNQIFLTITSIKKFANPETKSSVLHYISFVVSAVLFAVYFLNKQTHGVKLFELVFLIPFLLGSWSFFIGILNLIKSKKK